MSDDRGDLPEPNGKKKDKDGKKSKKRKKGKKSKKRKNKKNKGNKPLKIVIHLPKIIVADERGVDSRRPPEPSIANERSLEYRRPPERVTDYDRSLEFRRPPERVTDYDRSLEYRRPPDEVIVHRRIDSSVDTQDRRHKWLHGGWLHALNVSFITLNVLAAVLPGILSTYFAIGFRTATMDTMRPTINRGDLMISRMVPVSTVDVGTIVTLIDVDTLKLEARRVLSKTTSGNFTTLTVGTDANPNQASPQLYVLRAKTRIPNIIALVPHFGYVSAVISAVQTRVAGGVFVLALNLVIAYKRRAQRRRDMWG